VDTGCDARIEPSERGAALGGDEGRTDARSSPERGSAGCAPGVVDDDRGGALGRCVGGGATEVGRDESRDDG
jgi:hypothetical protein